jgi:hypothetical protein
VQGAVDSLQNTGLATAFDSGPVAAGGQHSSIRLSLIGVLLSDRAAVDWQRLLQAKDGSLYPPAYLGRDAVAVLIQS